MSKQGGLLKQSNCHNGGLTYLLSGRGVPYLVVAVVRECCGCGEKMNNRGGGGECWEEVEAIVR